MDREHIILAAKTFADQLLGSYSLQETLGSAAQRVVASDYMAYQRAGALRTLLLEAARAHGQAMGEAIAAAKSSTSS